MAFVKCYNHIAGKTQMLREMLLCIVHDMLYLK